MNQSDGYGIGQTWRTIRNDTIVITEIHADAVTGVITKSPDAENINQYDIFRKSTLIAQETN